ncbi:MAG: hypothetical protein QNJ72_45340 [Pleurocapsa sp. MO_226.B13]|nr:hypothetical protein [Pleurocapsa sp. MO_226.B13]
MKSSHHNGEMIDAADSQIVSTSLGAKMPTSYCAIAEKSQDQKKSDRSNRVRGAA